MGGLTGSRASTEPVCPVSALTGFDPGEGGLVALVTKAILFADCGNTTDWQDNIEIGQAAVDALLPRLLAPLDEIMAEYRAYGTTGIDVMYQIAADARTAIATEARRAETLKDGSVHEGAGRNGITQPSPDTPNSGEIL